MTQTHQMTDQEVQTFVTDELKYDPSVEGNRVTVTAHSGTVKLSGETMSLSEKLAAKRSAMRVRGVTSIVDEMTVRTPTTDARTDSGLAEAATKMLDWAADVPAESVKVAVRANVVTLSGNVAWEYQREAAARTVSHLRGITGIKNSIALYQPSNSTPTRNTVAAAMKRCAQLDPEKIEIEVQGHELVLRGNVGSFAEYRQAEHIAWAAPGVTKVSNNLLIAS